MAYVLKAVTIETDNTEHGMECIRQLWQDVLTGVFPVLFNKNGERRKDVFPIACYENYQSDETGVYDLTILAADETSISQLEKQVAQGIYRKYEVSEVSDDAELCTQKAWQQVWQAQQAGNIKRAFTVDYEYSMPAMYTSDGVARCVLYISVEG